MAEPPASTAPVDVLLPAFGGGYIARKSDATRYGTAFTIAFIARLGARWLAANPGGPRLQIGDLSPKGGGPCPNGRRDAQGNPLFHKSHRGGVDFDVQIIRADRKELFRSIQISDPSTHGPTQGLVTLIEELARGHLRFIFTAGTRFLKGAHLQYEAEHTYHLHVRLFQ
jgi:hypothetical protein